MSRSRSTRHPPCGRAERGEFVRYAAADAAPSAGYPHQLAGEKAGSEYAAVAR